MPPDAMAPAILVVSDLGSAVVAMRNATALPQQRTSGSGERRPPLVGRAASVPSVMELQRTLALPAVHLTPPGAMPGGARRCCSARTKRWPRSVSLRPHAHPRPSAATSQEPAEEAPGPTPQQQARSDGAGASKMPLCRERAQEGSAVHTRPCRSPGHTHIRTPARVRGASERASERMRARVCGQLSLV